jgi:type I restriction enzyme S subunit
MKWELHSIAEMGKVVTGKTPSTKNANYWDGEYPFVTPSDLEYRHYYCATTERSVSSEARDRLSNQFIPEGAVMFTSIGNTIGKCGIASRECLTNQQINSVIANEERDNKFIYYILCDNVDQIKGLGGGSATPIVNKTSFEKIRFRIPDYPTRSRIASILAAYDDLIENNLRRIKLLEESAKLLYKEWFVRLRFPGYEHTRIIKGMPEVWEKKKLGEVCQAVGGGTPSTAKSEYWENGDIIWVIPSDITKNNCLVLLDSEKKITEQGFKNSSARMVPPDTILMTSRASVGFFGLIDKEVCTNQGFISVIPNENIFRMYLLHNLMFRREEILSKAGGTTYKEITKSTFREMEIRLPSRALLKEFHDFAYGAIKQIKLLKKQTEKLKQARDILLPKLMSGEVEV